MPGDTAPEDENQHWRITAKAAVGKTIAHYDLNDPDFVPTLEEILNNLKENPFQYPTKEGPLAALRGVDLHFKGAKYRLLYQIFKSERKVRLIVLDQRKSDSVYRRAKRAIGKPEASDVEIESPRRN